ncbi:phosphoglycerol transferase MdoB-like AlkP superfamily enzyme [Oceanisphaera litoralis]|uniref:YijD family membrane protein n=1 Tax=Oceanisphaera litoralis TaxID=225144 RepID=UPI001957DF84|nr:YijD family membrane protein [Oceanisphaera litoralis]MBM7457204.1 phosphoglycerol transferase MdoB-like AlkP superfamily enzyme [Oceanisphaera litoralis]
MSGNKQIRRKPVLFALLVGLCGNATLATLSVSQLAFSIFPIIALVLAAYILYQEYLSVPMEGDTPLCTLLAFLIGVFGYSAFLRTQFPELGTNYLSVMISLVLVIWLALKMGVAARPTAE